MDRAAVESFLVECQHVLKPGGVLRIVVPDLEVIIRTYIDTLQALERGDLSMQTLHQQAIEALLGQIVLREASATAKQRPLVRWLENRFLGDAQTRGETHRWMYDWYSLKAVLERSGFINVARLDPNTSKIPMWEDSNLDVNCDGTIYKSGSLYVEGEKG